MPGNHLKKLLAMEKAGELPTGAGEIHNVIIRHDDWCALLVSGDECNCDPEIQKITPVEKE